MYSLSSSLICFFESYIVTSVTALVFNFLPFAFIYTFAGYRYPMAVALAVVSLYFLHVGFRNGSPFCLSLGGIAAGLCLASSISGKQYLLALVIAAPLYGYVYWRRLKQSVTWTSLALVGYGFLAAAAPILLYIVFNRERLHLYESSFLRDFWHAMQSAPFPDRNQAFYRAALELLFQYPGSAVLYSRYFAYSAAVLLVVSARSCTRTLAEAF